MGGTFCILGTKWYKMEQKRGKKRTSLNMGGTFCIVRLENVIVITKLIS